MSVRYDVLGASLSAVDEPNIASRGEIRLGDQAKDGDDLIYDGQEQSKTEFDSAEKDEDPTLINPNDTGNQMAEVSSALQAAANTNIAPSMYQQPLANWPGEAFAMYRTLAKLQHKFFGVQTRLNSERDAVKPKLDSLNDSLSELGRLLEQLAERKITQIDEKIWTNAVDQFSTGRQSFEDQIQVVDDEEQRLGRLLYKLAKLEPEFLQIVDAYFKSGQEIRRDSSTRTSSPLRSASPTLVPLEQQYYDKRRHVQALREQLSKHMAASHIPPDEDSTGDQYMRTAVVEELNSAERQLEYLEKQCQDAQINTAVLDMKQLKDMETLTRSPNKERQDLEPSHFNTPAFLPQDRHGAPPDFVREVRWSKGPERIAPFIEDLVKFTGKREFIESWVGQLPLNKPAPPEPVEFEHEVSSARSEPEWAYLHWTGENLARNLDYVMVPNDDEFAPNGEALETQQPGIIQRVLRRVISDGALNAGFGQGPKPSSRGSRQFHRSTEPNESADP